MTNWIETHQIDLGAADHVTLKWDHENVTGRAALQGFDAEEPGQDMAKNHFIGHTLDQHIWGEFVEPEVRSACKEIDLLFDLREDIKVRALPIKITMEPILAKTGWALTIELLVWIESGGVEIDSARLLEDCDQFPGLVDHYAQIAGEIRAEEILYD